MTFVPIKSSKGLTVYLLAIHLGAAALPLALAIDGWLRGLIWAALAVSLAWQLRRSQMLGGRLRALRVTPDEPARVFLVTEGGEEPCRLEAWRVLPFAVVLGLRPTGARRRRWLLLPADALAADALRRLRVFLRRLDAAG